MGNKHSVLEDEHQDREYQTLVEAVDRAEGRQPRLNASGAYDLEAGYAPYFRPNAGYNPYTGVFADPEPNTRINTLRSAIRQPSYPVYPPPQAGYRTEIQNATNPPRDLFSNEVRYGWEPPIRADGGVYYDPRRPYSPPPSPRGHASRLESPPRDPVIVVPPVRSYSPPCIIRRHSPSRLTHISPSRSRRSRSRSYSPRYRRSRSSPRLRRSRSRSRSPRPACRSRSRSRSPRRRSPSYRPRRLSQSSTRRTLTLHSPIILPIPIPIPYSQPQSRSPSVRRRLSTIDSVPVPLVLDDATSPVRPHSRPSSSPRHHVSSLPSYERETRSRSNTRSTKSGTRLVCRSPSPARARPDSVGNLSTKSSPKPMHRGSRSSSPRGRTIIRTSRLNENTHSDLRTRRNSYRSPSPPTTIQPILPNFDDPPYEKLRTAIGELEKTMRELLQTQRAHTEHLLSLSKQTASAGGHRQGGMDSSPLPSRGRASPVVPLRSEEHFKTREKPEQGLNSSPGIGRRLDTKELYAHRPPVQAYRNIPYAVGLGITSVAPAPQWQPAWRTFPLKVFRGSDYTIMKIQAHWDDEALLRELRKTYDRLRTWRKWLSLRNVRSITMVLADHSFVFPQRVGPAQISPSKNMRLRYYLSHPRSMEGRYEFIQVFTARTDLGIEFVERFQLSRIAIAVILPIVFATLFGIIWAVLTGDVSSAFTVSGYITSAYSVCLVLVGVLNLVET